MYPINTLSELDKETLQRYFELYAGVHDSPIDTVLKAWSKNKNTLFKAFGQKLRIKKKVTIPRDSVLYQQKLQEIYRPCFIYYFSEVKAFTNYEKVLERTKNSFIADVFSYFCIHALARMEEDIAYTQDKCLEDARHFSDLFKYGYLEEGRICSHSSEYHFHLFKSTIKPGMKIFKTIQNVLKAMNYTDMTLFNNWRNKVNNLSMNQNLSANLVLSIHPLDFVTMSDNACNWHSCMGWISDGCYHAGTLEMMNSNMAVVAYLENENPFYFDEEKKYTAPNKSWRALLFVHKNIMLVGKNYPFYNKDLCLTVLDFMRHTLNNTLHWKYQFINQEYRDMIHFFGNSFIRDELDLEWDRCRTHNSIMFYTYGMYNDIIEDTDTIYWCCRNKIKKSMKISLSGTASCLCCGEPIIHSSNIAGYGSLGHKVICQSCKTNNSCRVCGAVKGTMKYHTKFGNFCSDECLNEMMVFPDLDIAIRKEIFTSSSRNKLQYVILSKTPALTKDRLETFIDNHFDTNIDFSTIQDFLRENDPEIELHRIPIFAMHHNLVYIPYSDNLFVPGTPIRLYVTDDSYTKETIARLKNRIDLREYLEVSNEDSTTLVTQ